MHALRVILLLSVDYFGVLLFADLRVAAVDFSFVVIYFVLFVVGLLMVVLTYLDC